MQRNRPQRPSPSRRVQSRRPYHEPVTPAMVAQEVIVAANRQHPADAVLRERLRARKTLSAQEASEASRLTFAYYRWQGWLDARQPLNLRIAQAQQLARKFAAAPDSFPDDELLARAVPDWVRGVMDCTGAWVRSLQREPVLWLRAKTGTGPALAKTLGDCTPFAHLADCLRFHGSADLFRTPQFQAGKFEVQDLSSQAVGLACAPRPGETWWDACAGEGGKLLHLSDLMHNQGLIWASDRADWRLEKLKRRAARAKVFNYRAVAWDGGPKLPTRTLFDGVLVDAPCSGLGTWGRNPHARWTTTPQDVTELAALQLQLLRHAAAALKPGGRLLYSVCTLTRAETTAVVEAFRAHAPSLQPLPLPNPLRTDGDDLPAHLLWPQTFGGNGMFIAAWRRS